MAYLSTRISARDQREEVTIFFVVSGLDTRQGNHRLDAAQVIQIPSSH